MVLKVKGQASWDSRRPDKCPFKAEFLVEKDEVKVIERLIDAAHRIALHYCWAASLYGGPVFDFDHSKTIAPIPKKLLDTLEAAELQIIKDERKS